MPLALIYSSHRMVRILLCYTASSLKLEGNTFVQPQPIVEVQDEAALLFICVLIKKKSGRIDPVVGLK